MPSARSIHPIRTEEEKIPIDLPGDFWDLSTDRKGRVWVATSTGHVLVVLPD